MRKRNSSPKIIIGTLDRVDFPEFGLFNVPAKIDTGAETSSIHCHRARIIEKDGQEYLGFKLLDPSFKNYQNQEFRTLEFEEREIKSSSGHAQMRYIVKIKISLFAQNFVAEFSLADRETMKYPVLLGKKLLKNRFLVDVSQKDLSYKLKVNKEPQTK